MESQHPRPGRVTGAVAAALFLGPANGLAQTADVLRPEPCTEAVVYLEVLARLTACAGEGRAWSQHALGVIYANGIDVREDDAQAALWFRMAAEQGYPASQNELGLLYADGDGVPEDDAEAIRWYRLAAQQGYAPAQGNLGVMYDNGYGVPEDDAEALRWYRLSAAQGFALAQYNIGVMYDNGDGVPEDDEEAVRWYLLSAAQGFVAAQYNLAVMYDSGDGIPEDDAEAVRWYRRAALQGFADAQHNLATMYDNGVGVAENDAEAVRWYRRAADQGHATAQFSLGVRYSRGDGVPLDEAEAMRWYELAAEQGEAPAQTNLGVLLVQRWYRYQVYGPPDTLAVVSAPVDNDLIMAHMWFALAAAQGTEAAEANRDKVEEWLNASEIAQAQLLAQQWIDAHPQIGSGRPETIRSIRRRRRRAYHHGLHFDPLLPDEPAGSPVLRSKIRLTVLEPRRRRGGLDAEVEVNRRADRGDPEGGRARWEGSRADPTPRD